uniref:UDP-N-acetylglucosamine transferase subunit ALG14 n=1 Tax=Caligus rogercresseyi TaxID=217165 RepID=C1BQ95_CALRO|nr:UDP-N-acetylglucosamine transferase subunit ALG14 homolog [Caligus rogercresseyi]
MSLGVWVSIALGFLLVVLRLFRELWNSQKYVCPFPQSSSIETLVVLGSGGHTSEMFKLLSALDSSSCFRSRIYAIAETDENSLERLKGVDPSGTIFRIPRSRSVAQSYASSVLSTLVAFKASFRLLLRVRPELLLVNGPGTCLPLCLVGWIYKKIGFLSPRTKIVFVESVCRIETLSLTGRLLRPFVDVLLVQWPELAQKFPGTTYIDRFI